MKTRKSILWLFSLLLTCLSALADDVWLDLSSNEDYLQGLAAWESTFPGIVEWGVGHGMQRVGPRAQQRSLRFNISEAQQKGVPATTVQLKEGRELRVVLLPEAFMDTFFKRRHRNVVGYLLADENLKFVGVLILQNDRPLEFSTDTLTAEQKEEVLDQFDEIKNGLGQEAVVLTETKVSQLPLQTRLMIAAGLAADQTKSLGLTAEQHELAYVLYSSEELFKKVKPELSARMIVQAMMIGYNPQNLKFFGTHPRAYLLARAVKNPILAANPKFQAIIQFTYEELRAEEAYYLGGHKNTKRRAERLSQVYDYWGELSEATRMIPPFMKRAAEILRSKDTENILALLGPLEVLKPTDEVWNQLTLLLFHESAAIRQAAATVFIEQWGALPAHLRPLLALGGGIRGHEETFLAQVQQRKGQIVSALVKPSPSCSILGESQEGE